MYGGHYYASNFYATAHYGNKAAADDTYYKADHYQSNYHASDHYNGDGVASESVNGFYKADHYQSNYHASDHYNGDGGEVSVDFTGHGANRHIAFATDPSGDRIHIEDEEMLIIMQGFMACH